jgi:hypothetical protein
MHYDCQKLTELISKVSKVKPLVDNTVDNFRDLKIALPVCLEIKSEVEKFHDYFFGDQVELRDSVAKKCGFAYVGKFNRHGLAVAEEKNAKFINELSNIGLKRESCLIDGDGTIIIPRSDQLSAFYKGCHIAEFSEGLAAVTIEAGPFGRQYYVNEKGEEVFDIKAKNIGNFKYDAALVEYHKLDQYALIDKKGEVIIKIDLDRETWFNAPYEGYLTVQRSVMGFCFFAPNGDRIPRNSEKYFANVVGDLNNGTALVKDKEKDGALPSMTDNGLYYVDQNGNKLNKGVLKHKLRAGTPFYDNRAYVQIDGNLLKPKTGINHQDEYDFNFVKNYIIDTAGNVIKELDDELMVGAYHDGSNDFSNGYVKFVKNTGDRIESFLIDRNGEIKLTTEKHIVNLSEGMLFLEKSDEIRAFEGTIKMTVRTHNLMTLEGRIIEPEVEINKTSGFKGGVAMVERYIGNTAKTESFYIDKKGRRVFS